MFIFTLYSTISHEAYPLRCSLLYLHSMRTLLVFVITLHSLLLSSQTHHVLVSTTMGDIKVMLYDDTPLHRDNFMRLTNSGHYDGTLFYRVVKDFVVQGGSSSSKKAVKGSRVGYGRAVNINAEFRENHFHKKGALCAPRQPQDINLFKKSDIAQFYFAVGRIVPLQEIENIERSVNVPIKKKLKTKYYTPHKPELDSLRHVDARAFNTLLRSIKDKIEIDYALSEKLEYSEEKKAAYTTIGGIPTLDGDYSVFGEIIEGMDVLDRIAALKTDKNNRPLTDVRMEVTVIK